MASARCGASEAQSLLLAVEINGKQAAKIGEFLDQGGTLLSRPKELGELGLRVSDTSPPEGDTPISLSSLPGIEWQLDKATQTLRIKAENSALLPTLIGPTSNTSVEVARSGIGAIANYDAVVTQAAGRTIASGALDLRAFSPWGTMGTTMLAYAGSNTARTALIRLDTAYTYADPETMRQYVVGDFVTGGLTSSRPIRLAGLQISSNFSTRPDLVTFPLPSVSGVVAVPSTLDVLLDGNRYVSRSVEAGPFELPQLPVVTGAGTVAMTLTNALGQQITVDLPVYTSAALLAPGLSSYSAQVGAIRENYGVRNNDYGNVAGIATYRRGITDELTAEATVEAGRGILMGGGGIALNLAGYAVLQASAQGSVAAKNRETGLERAQSGTQFAVGLQRVGRVVSLSASATMASASFRDLASINGDLVPQLRLNASAGLSLGRFGSVAASYTGVDRSSTRTVKAYIPPGLGVYDPAAPLGNFIQYQTPRRTHLLSASYSVQLNRVSMFLTGYKDLARRGSAGVLLSFSIPLGGRTSASAAGSLGSGAPSAQAQVQQSVSAVGDWGYRASGAVDNTSHAFAELSYKSPWGLVSAGADRTGHHTAGRVTASGATSILDGSTFMSNTISDSFAVVDTDRTPNIRVLQENRQAGRTNEAGQLLVTDLRSFDVNRLAIDPNDVSPDIALETTTRDVRPHYHSGVVIHFPMHSSQGALVRLVDDGGAVMPLGSVARLRPGANRLPVGFDGEVYVEQLKSKAELVVERPDGKQCLARFDFASTPGLIPKIGPIQCRSVVP